LVRGKSGKVSERLDSRIHKTEARSSQLCS